MTEHGKTIYFFHYCSKVKFCWFLRVNLACGRYSTGTTVVQILAICSWWFFLFLIMENARYILLYALLQLTAIITWVYKQTLHFLQKFPTIKLYDFWTKNKSENPGSDLPGLKPLLLRMRPALWLKFILEYGFRKKPLSHYILS